MTATQAIEHVGRKVAYVPYNEAEREVVTLESVAGEYAVIERTGGVQGAVHVSWLEVI